MRTRFLIWQIQDGEVWKPCHVILSASQTTVKSGKFQNDCYTEKTDARNVGGFCGHCITVFEAVGCYCQYCPCQEARPPLIEEGNQRDIRKRELDELRKQHIQKKGFNALEFYECDSWKIYKTDNFVKQHLREPLPYKLTIREERLLENSKSGSLFGYAHCDTEVPVNLRDVFANFPPIFKNVNIGKDDVGPFMKHYAEKEGLLSQLRRMLISSYFWRTKKSLYRCCSVIWTWGWFANKLIVFCQKTLLKCFNNFVQSAVNARRGKSRSEILLLFLRRWN